jgi:hypothetical protein
MALGDITSVFSRYFVVGFFLPAYFSLVALWISSSAGFVPNTLQRHSETSQIAILGGGALVVGLALSGLRYFTIRLFEGYPLGHTKSWPVLGRLYARLTALQARTYNRLIAIRDDPQKSNEEQSDAAWRAERFFPQDEHDLLPTRMGNTIRAFEQHSNVRWGLDGVTVWPRINALLTADERELRVDAETDLYVFINGALGAFVVGICLIVDKAVFVPQPTWEWSLYVIPFVVGYLIYRAAVSSAALWGDTVRASIDLHRLELYEKLGVRAPTSFSDERSLALEINPALLYGEPLPADELWRRDKAAADDGAGNDSGLIECLKSWWKGG